MWIRLVLALVLLPLVELWLLLRIGAWLGLGATIALVVVTGIVGATLARREGVHAWSAVRDELAAGRPPAGKLLEAVLVLLAGVVLVTPGVLTDVAGLLLLVRPVRASLVRRLEERYRRSLGAFPREPDEDSGPGGRVIEI